MGTTAITPNTDRFTEYQVGISGDHAYIHKGRGYVAAGSATVNTGAETTLLLTTPASSSAYVHYRPSTVASVSSPVTVTLYEAPTATGGSAGTPTNRNRNSDRAATVVYKYGASYSSGGTVLDISSVGSGGNPVSRSGGASGQDLEFVLKPETTYAIRIVNPAGGANSTVVWSLFWYEEDSGI